jgi:hypothetical protein
MPIPAQVLTLLGKPVWGPSGTRDANLTPSVHFTWGLRASEDRAHVEILVPAPFLGALPANLADNQRIVLTITENNTHEAYQLKGRSTEVRASTDDERSFQRGWADRNLAYLRASGFPEHLAAALNQVVMAPATYVRFYVEEVYLQTPGPSAGQLIPLED